MSPRLRSYIVVICLEWVACAPGDPIRPADDPPPLPDDPAVYQVVLRVTTVGVDLDANGYVLIVGADSVAIPPDTVAVFTVPAANPAASEYVHMRLEDVAINCAMTPPTASARIVAGVTDSVTFRVECGILETVLYAQIHVSGSRLRCIRVDGSLCPSPQVGLNHDFFFAAVSSDRGLLAFSAGPTSVYRSWTIGVFDLAGGTSRQVNDSLQAFGSFAWVPGTHHLVAAVERGADGYPADQLFVLDADGSDVWPLTADTVETSHPAVAPAGDRLAYLTGSAAGPLWRHVNVMGLGGTNPRTLAAPLARGFSAPAWSPDGTHLLFAGDLGGNDEVFVLAPADLGVQNVTMHPAVDRDPQWLPDGTIAYQSNRAGPWRWFVTDPDGANTHQLTGIPDDAQLQGGSPSGRFLMYRVQHSDRSASLEVLNVVTGQTLRIVDNEGIQDKAWLIAWFP